MPDAPGRGGGDDARFRQLFDDHYRIVMSFALRRTRTADDANDITSETFAVAWRRLDVVPEDRDGQVSWLLATARRVLANHHRSHRRRHDLQARVEADSGAPVTRDVAESATEVQLVRAALDQLGEVDREILRLAAWEDLPHGQIAQILDLSVTAVSVRLHRARGRLTDVLERLGHDTGGGGA